MPYSSNSTINGLDAETSIADTDELIFGDVSDTNRAKKITFANLKTEIVGDDTAFVRKADYDANSILYATADNTPVALTVGTNSVVGRVAGAITTLAVDSELSSVSTSDDTVPSAKATKTALDLKSPITAPTFQTSITGAYLTASEILITNGSKNIVSAPVATYPSLTELAYLKGATSNLQTQISAIGIPSYKNGTTSKDLADASTTQNIAHGLGSVPKTIALNFAFSSPGFGRFVYNGTTKSTVGYVLSNGAYRSIAGTDVVLYESANNVQYQTGVVTWDATNIIITWVKTNSPTGTWVISWEAEV